MLISLIRSGYEPKEILLLVLLYILALSIAFSFHEFMHAVTANKLGDPTPKIMGRVTLNPLAHVDPRGLILLLILGFGWGKPVTFNPNYLTKIKSKKIGIILVSAAGVVGNFFLALVGTVLEYVLISLIPQDSMWYFLISMFFTLFVELNLCLMAFNLLPIPPLDGFGLLNELLPVRAKYTRFYKGYVQYGPIILLAACLLGNLSGYPVFSTLIEIISMPARLLLNLIGMGIFNLLA